MRLLELFSHRVLRGGLENIYFFYQHNWRKSDTNTIGHLAVEQMVSLVHSSRLREMKYGYGERVCVWMVYFIENEKILLLHLTSQS